MLTTSFESNPHCYGPGWTEFLITLSRDDKVIGTFRVYSVEDSPSLPPGRWHMISVGNFASVQAAADHLVKEWDREPTDAEMFQEEMAEARYRAGYEYACGCRN